jgi:oligopeptide transport system substrate-binding protein
MAKHRVFFFFAVAPLLAGCGSNDAPSYQVQDDSVVVIRRGNGGDPGSLDPALAEDLHAYNVLGDLFEGLLTATADGGLAPGAAISWTVSPDGKLYRFSLREDALWSNGRRVTAGHFVNGFRHALQAASRSPNAFLLEPILNSRKVLRGELSPESLGVRSEGAGTLVIELDRPASWLPTVLTMPISMPRLTGIHDDAASYSVPGKFVGNGPYVLAEWSPGDVLRLRRSESFHAADSVAIERVDYLPIADPAAEFNLFRASELDVTATIPPSQFESVSAERPCELQSTPGLGLYYLAFDLTEPPFDNPRLREALSLAIDRTRLVRMLGRGELPAFGLVSPAVASHRSAAHDWRDVDQPARERMARAALAAAGYETAKPPPVELTYDAGDVHEQVALAVRSMWQEVLGIDVNLRQLEWKAFLDLRSDRRAWQIMRFVWVGDYDDASTFTDLFVSGGPNNLPGFANSRYDGLLRRAAETDSEATRGRLLEDAERLLLEEHAIAPLYFMTNKHLVSGRIEGYLPNALDRHPSRYIGLRGINPRSGNSATARCGSDAAVSGGP